MLHMLFKNYIGLIRVIATYQVQVYLVLAQTELCLWSYCGEEARVPGEPGVPGENPTCCPQTADSWGSNLGCIDESPEH